jgi:arylsulfatase A-like enzyme
MQNELIQFIKNNKDEPFFMYYANPIPHVPLQAPKRWVDYYVKKFGDEEPYTGDRGYFPHRYPRAAYAAMVSYFDEQVGEIVAT